MKTVISIEGTNGEVSLLLNQQSTNTATDGLKMATADPLTSSANFTYELPNNKLPLMNILSDETFLNSSIRITLLALVQN